MKRRLVAFEWSIAMLDCTRFSILSPIRRVISVSLAVMLIPADDLSRLASYGASFTDHVQPLSAVCR
jgi:hypothetical protein